MFWFVVIIVGGVSLFIGFAIGNGGDTEAGELEERLEAANRSVAELRIECSSLKAELNATREKVANALSVVMPDE